MKENFHKYAHKIFFGVFILAVVAALVYSGAHYYKTYKQKQDVALAVQLQQEAEMRNEATAQDKARDEEISLLKQQLAELKNKPPETKTITNTVQVEAKDPVANIVKKWSPRVAHIECHWYDAKGNLYAQGSASATLINFIGLGMRAVTNKHVMVFQGYLPRDCDVELTTSAKYTVTTTKENVSIGQDEDWAYVTLPKDAALSSITAQNVQACKNVEVGDKLLILGYPKIGAKTGLTVTEGIVSANDKNYYITSAKIDKGNSGGAAVLVDGDCYLGIPSASVVGQIESLGRILKSNFVIGG